MSSCSDLPVTLEVQPLAFKCCRKRSAIPAHSELVRFYPGILPAVLVRHSASGRRNRRGLMGWRCGGRVLKTTWVQTAVLGVRGDCRHGRALPGLSQSVPDNLPAVDLITHQLGGHRPLQSALSPLGLAGALTCGAEDLETRAPAINTASCDWGGQRSGSFGRVHSGDVRRPLVHTHSGWRHRGCG